MDSIHTDGQAHVCTLSGQVRANLNPNARLRPTLLSSLLLQATSQSLAFIACATTESVCVAASTANVQCSYRFRSIRALMRYVLISRDLHDNQPSDHSQQIHTMFTHVWFE